MRAGDLGYWKNLSGPGMLTAPPYKTVLLFTECTMTFRSQLSILHSKHIHNMTTTRYHIYLYMHDTVLVIIFICHKISHFVGIMIIAVELVMEMTSLREHPPSSRRLTGVES